MCTGKTVLHLGFVEHDFWRERKNEGRWLHDKIAAVAKELTGLDYLDKEVMEIRNEFGYDCLTANVEHLEELTLNKTYEVVVCGELIEHLSNPGLMLEGVKRFLAPDSILIITTPNPFSQQRIRLIQENINEPEWLNKEHTCWFSFETLKQLLERFGYGEVKYYYYDLQVEAPIGLKGRIRDMRSGKLQLNRDLKKPFLNNHDGLFFVTKHPA